MALPDWPSLLYRRAMLIEYLSAAMAKAHYELLGDGEGFYGDIPGFQGVFAQAATLEACRTELASTLEDWLLFRISRHLPIPTVQGIDLTIREVAA
jgi:predicted RNase H-like HicB family nuclease